jgi:hypothetical protein
MKPYFLILAEYIGPLQVENNHVHLREIENLPIEIYQSPHLLSMHIQSSAKRLIFAVEKSGNKDRREKCTALRKNALTKQALLIH